MTSSKRDRKKRERDETEWTFKRGEPFKRGLEVREVLLLALKKEVLILGEDVWEDHVQMASRR